MIGYVNEGFEDESNDVLPFGSWAMLKPFYFYFIFIFCIFLNRAVCHVEKGLSNIFLNCSIPHIRVHITFSVIICTGGIMIVWKRALTI